MACSRKLRESNLRVPLAVADVLPCVATCLSKAFESDFVQNLHGENILKQILGEGVRGSKPAGGESISKPQAKAKTYAFKSFESIESCCPVTSYALCLHYCALTHYPRSYVVSSHHPCLHCCPATTSHLACLHCCPTHARVWCFTSSTSTDIAFHCRLYMAAGSVTLIFKQLNVKYLIL